MRDECDLDSMRARQNPYADRRGPTSDDDLDAIIEDATVDAYGMDEGMSGFEVTFDDQVEFPVRALVIGRRVEVVGVHYGGNEHRGLEARVRSGGRGGEHEVSVLDVLFEKGPEDMILAAYKRWLGM